MVNKYDFRVRAAITSWYDGDTPYGAVDHGSGIFRAGGMKVAQNATSGLYEVVLEVVRQRAALIDAPELKVAGKIMQDGVDARDYAALLAPPGVYSCITYKSDDNFDRPLIDLILPDGRMFSAAMLEAGHAVPYKN